MESAVVKYAPGMRIIVRGEEWMVKKVETNSLGNQTLHVVGLSQLVKDYDSMFLVDVEKEIEIVDPAKVTLVPDDSAFFRKSKVYIESQWRGKIPTDKKIHIGDKAAMDLMHFQLEPAQMALDKTRQRILIADTVGLGKTLEAGILMSELIARGKGKRILVVTVKSMMTQFQKEMWNRFTIPLVRLDSAKIQSIRAKLPTNYNPFFYYDKTIISIDTLKNDLDYRAHLENAWWDIIVIDEAHNVAKRGDRGSQRSKLASLLATRSDTLIMLSATPHDGKGQSVASLMNMLDPTAIADEQNYGPEDTKGYIIRRFKKDVQDQVSATFKERKVTTEKCPASAREEYVYDIFAEMQLQMDQSKTIGSATAVSAGISELYASRFNDDKKLLAFTDNVQDAAHHAGFYNARTWKFGLRTAVTKFQTIDDTEYSLSEFLRRVSDYWKNMLGNENYVAHFIPESMKWMRAYKSMCEKGALEHSEDTDRLLSFVDQRTRYEILLEYGILSRVGRSLEKSGCSVVSFEFDEAIPRIMERVANEVGALQSEGAETFYKIVMGLLYEMKSNGAYSYYVYDPFIDAGGNSFMISNKRIKWMPGEHKGRNVPKYIAINHGTKKLGYFDQPDSRSWYGNWISKYLPIMSIESDAFQIAKIILEELTSAGVLVKTETPADVDVWAINSDACKVTRKVHQMVCDKCGCQMSASEDNADKFKGAFCIRRDCSGHMQIADDEELDFYGKLYSQGEMIRIVAKEHTGLLERDDRESLEKTFKKAKEDKKPWDANLLSCTPTLEMGIDIGDLSTVVLCSIPPAQAQYAQRAGRGGRKDGNALTVAVASAKPHDLYFYEDPMEMIAGTVEPPKVFLKASAVLARQFTAYCMDCWVKSGSASIPQDVGACLAKLDEKNTDRFPNNFMNYVQTNLSKLVRTFINTFSANPGGNGGLDESAIADIKKFAMDCILGVMLDTMLSLRKYNNNGKEEMNGNISRSKNKALSN